MSTPGSDANSDALFRMQVSAERIVTRYGLPESVCYRRTERRVLARVRRHAHYGRWWATESSGGYSDEPPF